MIRSYLKVALRSFQKNKLISFINIFGLGLSMSVGLMILIRLQDQLSYDNFHPYPDRTYRITSEYAKKNSERWKMASTPLPLHEKLQKEVSNIEASVVVYPAFGGNATANGKQIYLNGAFTEPSFFRVFGFSMKQGDAGSALQKPNSIVLSKETADKFFGTENPIGKIFTMESGENFVVTGILDTPPQKSHLDFNVLVSYSTVAQMEHDKQLPERLSDWFAFNAAYTYVVLKPGYSESSFRKELGQVANELNAINKEGVSNFTTQAIDKITPGTDYLSNDRSGSSWSKFYFEIGIALIILLAACFNYTNLTIARALTRAKEVGIRKVTGAKRSQVFLQYVIESVLLSFLSLLFAWTILAFIIQYAPFNDDYEFIPSSFHYNLSIFEWSAAFALFTGILAGVSPAWILSSFKPIRVLKNLTTARIVGKVSLQKALIVFQYSLSLVVIIFLVAFYRQFSYMADADPGFKRDNVLVVPLNGIDSKIAVQQISGISGVISVGATSSSFSKRFNGVNTHAWLSNKQDALSLNYYYTDKAFVKDMQFALLAGNNFPSATNQGNAGYILINEQASIGFGFKNFSSAIGQSVWLNDSTQLQVVGVLKNFTYENAGSPIRPLALRCSDNAYNYLYVTTAGKINKKALATQVDQSMKALRPSQDFTSSWLNEELDRGNSQTATVSLLGYLAFMAFAIASLGLLGLVTYTVQVKRKEISIRKIIGAGEKQLVRMLSKGFVKLLVIAGIIAIPIGYTAGYLFLQNFSNRVSFGIIGPFLCFLFLFVIGFVTIFSQTYKAATANPVKDLRME
jgi:putative ABC transport system permease protein